MSSCPGGSTDLVVPLEVGRDGELHLEGGAGDGLKVHGQVQLGELVDVLVDGLSHLGHADQLSWRTETVSITSTSRWALLILD